MLSEKQQMNLQKNFDYEIAITGMTNEGNGVGRIGDYAVFVPDTAIAVSYTHLDVYKRQHFACGACAMKASYENGVTDEFVVPAVIEGGAPIQANDSVIFFNFRPDRAREITRTLVDDDFTGFARKNGRFPLYFVCMTQYDATMPNVDAVSYTHLDVYKRQT